MKHFLLLLAARKERHKFKTVPNLNFQAIFKFLRSRHEKHIEVVFREKILLLPSSHCV